MRRLSITAMAMLSRTAFGLMAAICLHVATAQAQDDEHPPLVIGFVDLKEDIRYDDWGVHPVDIRSATAISDRRGFPGAELGLSDIQKLQRMAKRSFKLERRQVDGADAAVEAIKQLHDQNGVNFVLLDLPNDVTAKVARETADVGVLLLNVSATGNNLRNDDCAAHLFHTAPSEAMLIDGLVQYLVAMKWREVLILRGPLPEDAVTVESFKRSSDLFGLDIVEVREFLLGADPRAREVNDLSFLTGEADYDVVFVADVDGEFALSVPYAVQDPAPVVGSGGLVPRAWHWSYLRHGAPQVHGRFERMHDRRMEDADWGAWVAMRAVGEAVVRAKSDDPKAIAEFMASKKFRVDGSKGTILSFRPWSNQLRQPVMLTTGNWVTARAPIEGFKHRVNDLDTLGYEERDTTCDF